MGKKRKKLKGRVEKVLPPFGSHGVEKAQVEIHEADQLYREIRVENVLTDEDGAKQKLKPGAEVEVILEADSDAMTDVKKPRHSDEQSAD